MPVKGSTLFLAAAVILASCSAESAPTETDGLETSTSAEAGATTNIQSIRSQDAKALLEQQEHVVILDIRTPGEYNAGHLKNARHIDFYNADFSERLQALDPAKAYLVYCAVGGRSREAVQLMGQLGFLQVYDAVEGFSALRKAGVPVE